MRSVILKSPSSEAVGPSSPDYNAFISLTRQKKILFLDFLVMDATIDRVYAHAAGVESNAEVRAGGYIQLLVHRKFASFCTGTCHFE